MSIFVITGLPYAYTGAMAHSLRNTSGALVYNGSIAINQIYWSGIGAVGNKYTIVDQTGTNVLATYTANSTDVSEGNHVVYYPSTLRCTDYQVTELDSGSLTLIVDWLIFGQPVGSVAASILGIPVSFTSAVAGNFTIPHTLGRVPKVGVIQMQAPAFGIVEFQSPVMYDASNIYLYASVPGLSGVVWLG